MSTALPERPSATLREPGAFALVVSRYNPEFTGALEQNAREELAAIQPAAAVRTFEAPGAFEIPLLVKLLAAGGKYDAILALGLILKGATAHADLIAATITNSLQKIALDHSVPIIHEVLLVDDEAQARARCMGETLNRGREAARAAIAAVAAVRSISNH